MQRFKTFLLEYLTDEQRKKYSEIKMTKKAKDATDPFFGDSDIKREELEDYDHDKSEIHKKVEQHLAQPLSKEDYVKGTLKDKYGRETKIGRLIKDPELRNAFASDNSRAGSKTGSSHYMTIVRGTEVAGQTNSAPDKNHPKGHSWGDQSCKNVDNGINRHYLDDEIHHGSVVVRAHDNNDQEIYRATLHPYENDHGHRMYAVNSEYGIKHPSFSKHAAGVAARLSGEHKGGSPVYQIVHNVYNDKDIHKELHPATSEEDITNMMNNMGKMTPSDIIAVLQHPKVTSRHVDQAYESGDQMLETMAAQHPKASDKTISKALDNEESTVRFYAMKNPNVSSKHIEKALNDVDPMIVRQALRHPKATTKQIEAGLNDPRETTRAAAAANPNITAEQLKRAHNDNHARVRTEAVTNPKTTSDQLLHAIKHDENPMVGEAAFNHPGITEKHIDAGIESEHPDIAFAAASHPKATPEHLEKAYQNANYYVRAAAISHPKASFATIAHAARYDPSTYVKHEAKFQYKKRSGKEFPED